MNGGVSLAIWMGGVTVEINRLVNADDVYGEVLDLTKSRVRVDVIAGASAGGINGAMLAAMISHDNSRDTELKSLRQIWLENGAMMTLFRSPLTKAPPSLMRGDEFFLPELTRVFEQLTDGRLTSAEDFPIRLTLTTTLLKAASRGFADDFGSLIADFDHRGEFTFRRGDGLEDEFDKSFDEHVAKRLALASRSTASFPAAFEPSWVPVGISEEEQKLDPHRPDMKGYVNFKTSRYCIDGGVLVNKPFRPAIRGIFAQRAERENLRRVLAYVVPDPSEVADDDPMDRAELGNIAGVIVSSGVTLPRAESVSRELEDIAEHNRRVQAQRMLRDHLLAPGDNQPVDIEALASKLSAPFREMRLQRIVDQLTTHVDPFQGKFDGLGETPWDTGEIRDFISKKAPSWLPSTFPDADATWDPSPWQWGNDTVEAIGAIALNLIGAGFALAREGTPACDIIAGARSMVHDHLRTLRTQILRNEPAFWETQAKSLQDHWTARALPAEKPATWEAGTFEQWLLGKFPDASLPGAIALNIARELTRASSALSSMAPSTAAAPTETQKKLPTLVEQLVPDPQTPAATLRRLLAQAVVQSVAAAGRSELDQVVELLEMSSTVPNGFDGRVKGSKKLAGIQLGHFGAFYKRSWRANDWMWGRMDGTARLVQMILNPARLAQVGLSSAQALDKLESIALGPADNPQREVLTDGSVRGWDRDAAARELAFLDMPEARAPKSLPVCARAVARRIQLRILQEELPEIANAIDFDIRDGAKEKGPADEFLRAEREVQLPTTQDGPRLRPGDAAGLLPRLRVGDEKVTDESGSDLFTMTLTTAAAVGVTAFSGASSGLPRIGRGLVAAFRSPVLWLWVMARNAVSSHKTGFAVLVSLLASGGALLAISALANVALPGVLAAAGTVLLLAGVALALLRLKVKRGLLAILGVVLVVAAFLAVPSIVVDWLIDPRETGALSWIRRVVPPAFAVIGLVLAGVLLGLVHAKPNRTPTQE
jgi:patatin-related protein